MKKIYLLFRSLLDFTSKIFIGNKEKEFIYTVNILNTAGREFSFTLGESIDLTQKDIGIVEQILIKKNLLTVVCDKFTIQHTIGNHLSIATMPIDNEKEFIKSLQKQIHYAKAQSILSPVIADSALEEINTRRNR